MERKICYNFKHSAIEIDTFYSFVGECATKNIEQHFKEEIPREDLSKKKKLETNVTAEH